MMNPGNEDSSSRSGIVAEARSDEPAKPKEQHRASTAAPSEGEGQEHQLAKREVPPVGSPRELRSFHVLCGFQAFCQTSVVISIMVVPRGPSQQQGLVALVRHMHTELDAVCALKTDRVGVTQTGRDR